MTTTQKKAKILYVITKGNWGGAQRYVFDLAAHLSREEFEPVVACGNDGVLTQKLRGAGIRTMLLPSLQRDISFGKEFRALSELLRLLRAEKPDIIHLNSSKAAFLGAFASRLFRLSLLSKVKGQRSKVPHIIFTVHGWPFLESRHALVRCFIWLASALTALLSTDVIVLSRGDLARGARIPCVRQKLHLIHNSIAEMKMVSREMARTHLSAEQEKALPDFWIGTIAELNRNKGIGCLIEAFAKLKQPATLCIIGDGEERARLETLTKKFGVVDRVLFAGFKENAAQYLKAFDIFILPSLKEGLPYALLEAGVAGLPVVATNLPGIHEIISSETEGVLVPPKDAAGFARTLACLIENPAERQTFGKNLAARVRERFSFPAMLKKTVGVYTNT